MTDQGTEVAEQGTEVVPATEETGALVTQPDHTPAPAAHGHHPTPRHYVMIAIVLVVATGIEIAVSYIDTGHTNWIIIALFVLAVLKFFLVTARYMHMQTDAPFFRRIFIVGLVGAGVLYGIMLFMFSSTTLKG
jgi:heme/copper-type cytochrome/quinol oxidase subunit 4